MNCTNQNIHATRKSLKSTGFSDEAIISYKTRYQLLKDGKSIDLTNRHGRKYSDATTANWDAIQAVQSDSGFQVLLQGTGQKEGKFKVWDVNSSGTITRGSGWKTTAQALNASWETSFGDVIQIDGTIGQLIQDKNTDGFVDDSPHYQLLKDGKSIDLTNRHAGKYSDATTANWDAIQAVQSDSGFQVLLQGTGQKEGKFKVWDVNSSGTITRGSGWKTTAQALNASWETSFGDVIQIDGTIGQLIQDKNTDGFVDDSPHYQLLKDGKSIDLTNRHGGKYSDATTANWDAIQAVQSDSGFQVLLQGTGQKEGKFKVWDVNSSGTITRGSGWKTTAQALNASWETSFGDVIQIDGTIGPINDGNATFSIAGTPAFDQQLTVEVLEDDPDGNGNFNYTWQSSFNSKDWSTISWSPSLTVSKSIEGLQVQALVNYTDGDGFFEIVRTDTVTIPYVDNGDASFRVAGTPQADQQLTIELLEDDPDGNGTFNFTWQSSSNSKDWTTIASGPSLTVNENLEGLNVQALVNYTDGDGFFEIIRTDSVTIAHTDNGDASFTITGTPEVNQQLSIDLIENDPDGNGDFDYTWQSSPDETTWSTITSGQLLTVSQNLAGLKVQARINYTDAEGHAESVFTESITIPNSDDFADDTSTKGNLSIGGTSSGELETAGDRDWFEVSLTDGASYEFNHIGNTLIDPYLYLRNQNGDLITSNDDGGNGYNSKITFDSTRTGSFYLDAGSYENSLTGTYTLSATQTSTPTPPDGDDFTDDTSTTGNLSIGETISGELEESGDRDWFEVSLTEGSSYEFDQIGNTLSDPYLYLRDYNGDLITSNDDGGTGYNSQITFNSTRTGSFYLDAGSYENSLTGTYSLSVSELPAPEPGFSSVDGWGEISASRAFNQLLDITLPSVEDLGGNLWGVDNVNAPEVWVGGAGFSGVTGEGITVAVIDTGVDLDHPEFTGRLTIGYDFVDNDTNADDGNGHGTHVAGTIAGDDEDGVGISGVAPDAKIMPIRVLNNNGSGYTSDIIDGIIWSTDNGADVINLSLGGGGYSQAMADAIAYASNNGTVVVMAAGNSSGSSPDYPAAHAIDHGLAVGAVDQNRAMASFSNRAGNTTLDYVTAPGKNIYSSVLNGNYDVFSGTSMATPHVAGVAALLKSYDKSLSASAIEDLLTGSASNAPTSNNLSTTSTSTNNINAFKSSTIITLDTLDQFNDDQLTTRLIGRVGDNYSQTNDELLRQMNDDIQSNSTDTIQSIGSITTEFISIDLADTANSVSGSELLSSLLENNQFEYFEVDSLRSTMQYTKDKSGLDLDPLESQDSLTGSVLNASIVTRTTQKDSSFNKEYNEQVDIKANAESEIKIISPFAPLQESTLSLTPTQQLGAANEDSLLTGIQPGTNDQLDILKMNSNLDII